SASATGDCKPEIIINDVTVTEGNSGTVNATFIVSLTAASAQTVTVDFATADGAATAPADYQSNNGTLTFNPGDTTRMITVLVNGDNRDEANETFFVNLSNAVNGVVIDSQGQATINDNDPAPSITINDVSVAEGDSGTTPLTFTVTLSTASGQTVTVNYTTADNTATSTSDYQATSGTLTFNPGDTTKTVTVLVSGDTDFEQSETFFVNLTMPANATLSENHGVGTIKNDDVAPPTPTFFITDVNINEGDSGTTTANFTVALTPASNNTVTVDFANLVISQVYPGGGLTNATYTNDFIELFNRGTTTIDFSVTPYSAQFLSTSGSTWARTDLTSGIILPGHYFLIKESGGATGAALPTADATGSINITSTTDRKVARVSSTTPLTGKYPGDDGTP